jgi:hypothetical protein
MLFYAVRVYFLDNSSKVFLIDDMATIKDLILLCLQKIGVLLTLDDSSAASNSTPAILPYFSLFECLNGSSIENDAALNLTAKVIDVIQSWAENNAHPDAKLLFLIRLYMPCLWGYQYRDVVSTKYIFPLTKIKS